MSSPAAIPYGTFARPTGSRSHGERVALVALTALLAVSLVSVAYAAQRAIASPAADGATLSVIVREIPGAGSAAEEAVARSGGTVRRHIGLINAFVADLPVRAVGALRATPGVHSVTPDGRVQLLTDDNSGSSVGDGLGFDGPAEAGTIYSVAKTVRASHLYDSEITGRGIGVAVIDSGVVPVPELAGQIVHGPDLSFESQADHLRNLDTYGHGTHMAGIIAGHDRGVPSHEYDSNRVYAGIAPDAHIVSVKVAVHSGATDVSQVIAAIDWVVQHRNDPGLNVRVLNLSFGTDGTQSYLLDPLTFAVEAAWRNGIVVVVAGGNAGFGSAKLNNPAYDPFVIAVGASESNGTIDPRDDTVASFSSRGDSSRRVDVVAPGRSIVSLRDRGSYLDTTYPTGRVGDRFSRGSGTSQAAAVVSGSVALLLQQRPRLTPDQVKYILRSTAYRLPAGDSAGMGAGLIDVKAASRASAPAYAQPFTPATGDGSLELARGSVHVSDGTGELTGEYDILGGRWDGTTWAPLCLIGEAWTGGAWNGNTWTGNTWTGNTWTGNTWTGNTWTGNTWTGNTWTGNTWTGNTWSGVSWGD